MPATYSNGFFPLKRYQATIPAQPNRASRLSIERPTSDCMSSENGTRRSNNIKLNRLFKRPDKIQPSNRNKGKCNRSHNRASSGEENQEGVGINKPAIKLRKRIVLTATCYSLFKHTSTQSLTSELKAQTM